MGNILRQRYGSTTMSNLVPPKQCHTNHKSRDVESILRQTYNSTVPTNFHSSQTVTTKKLEQIFGHDVDAFLDVPTAVGILINNKDNNVEC